MRAWTKRRGDELSRPREGTVSPVGPRRKEYDAEPWCYRVLAGGAQRQMDAAVLGASVRAASISVGKSVAIVVVGWIVCRRRFKGGRQTVRDVTQSLVFVYNPCLSITNLISTLTADKLLELWLLPVYSYALAALGMLLGLCISALFDRSGVYRPVVVASTACGNGFSLPLSMAGALMFSVDWIRDDPQAERLYTYIFLYVITAGTIMFGPIYYIMGVPSQSSTLLSGDSDREEDEEAGEGTMLLGVGGSDCDDSSGSIYSSKDSGGGSNHQVMASSGASPQTAGNTSLAIAKPTKLGGGAFLRKIVNPPLLASFAGVTLACIAPIREAFLGTVLFDSIQSVGVASPPVMLINLGAQMSLQDRTAGRAVPWRLMAGIVVGRLVVMPLVTAALIFGSVSAGFLPPDRILLLLLLLQGATPTAMSLGTISQMHGQWMDEIAEIMFVVNVVSVPFFTFSVATFLALLDPQAGFLECLL